MEVVVAIKQSTQSLSYLLLVCCALPLAAVHGLPHCCCCLLNTQLLHDLPVALNALLPLHFILILNGWRREQLSNAEVLLVLLLPS